MICPNCQIESTIYRQVNVNGAKVVVDRCPQCRQNARPGQPFLPVTSYDWDSLPLFVDNSRQIVPRGTVSND